jgi:hypothetical protein
MTGQISRAKKNLTDTMTPEQLREAERKAAAWQNAGKLPIPPVQDEDKVRPFRKVTPAAMDAVWMS